MKRNKRDRELERNQQLIEEIIERWKEDKEMMIKKIEQVWR